MVVIVLRAEMAVAIVAAAGVLVAVVDVVVVAVDVLVVVGAEIADAVGGLGAAAGVDGTRCGRRLRAADFADSRRYT